MAELLAIGKDLKNLTPVTKLGAGGSAVIKLEGNAEYRPELKLTKEDINSILRGLSAVSSTANIIPSTIPFNT